MATISELIASLGKDLEPLMSFLTSSAWATRKDQPTACDFVAGNPQEMPLPGIADALIRWTEPKDKDWFAYKEAMPSASEAAAAGLRRDTGIDVAPEDVFLTPGAFGAISVALRTIVDPGDEVIFISPPWFFYEGMIRAAGGVPVRVTSPGPDFPLEAEAVARAITPRTRAVLVNTPNNPTGRIYTPEELRALAGVLSEASARLGRSITLLSDESYRRIVFDGRAFHPPASFYPDTLVLYTYGKTLLTPGQRLGYIALPPEMPNREQVRGAILLAQVIGGWQMADNIMRFALPELEDLSVNIDALQRRRDRIVGALSDMGYELRTPEATFYLVVRSPDADDWAFTARLGERDVFVLPGGAFELPGFFRISFTATDDMVERALPVFADAIAR